MCRHRSFAHGNRVTGDSPLSLSPRGRPQYDKITREPPRIRHIQPSFAHDKTFATRLLEQILSKLAAQRLDAILPNRFAELSQQGPNDPAPPPPGRAAVLKYTEGRASVTLSTIVRQPRAPQISNYPSLTPTAPHFIVVGCNLPLLFRGFPMPSSNP